MIDDHIYIGSTVDFKKRWRIHRSDLRKNIHVNRHLQNAWNKYGENCFVFEKLETCLNKSFLTKLEQYYIDNLEPEYNICRNAGSVLGIRLSEEARQKISELQTGNKNVEGKHWQWNEEAKAKMSIARRGSGNPFYGKTPSEEAKKKMSEAKKSYWVKRRLELCVTR